mgnify:CR=1 FL=1
MKHVKRRQDIAKTETTKLEVKTQYSESKQNEQKERAVDLKKVGSTFGDRLIKFWDYNTISILHGNFNAISQIVI